MQIVVYKYLKFGKLINELIKSKAVSSFTTTLETVTKFNKSNTCTRQCLAIAAFYLKHMAFGRI